MDKPLTDEELNNIVNEMVLQLDFSQFPNRRDYYWDGSAMVPSPKPATRWEDFGLVVEEMGKRGWTTLQFHVTYNGSIMAMWAKPFLSGDEEVLDVDSTRLRAGVRAAIRW